ncbi:hypothetical protein PCANC_11709 [Puccinia coronata f. sp. avenae]|uniref:Uncharacterized protein n=1 Tax=Puccinia coronata f. sp. avenae TaxID=200324 RepID=A0A2N5STE2_9BASI|nr:hypothetical protein PCANC_11709 [Puccinia coronata f. sp. avenae]
MSHHPTTQERRSSSPRNIHTPPASTGNEDPKPSDQAILSTPPTTTQTTNPHLVLRDKVHALSKDWLAGMRADFLEVQELMNINQQLAQDFGDWVEAGAIDSLVRQEKVLRESLNDIHFLESQAEAERDRMDLAISEMKRITDRLLDSSS